MIAGLAVLIVSLIFFSMAKRIAHNIIPRIIERTPTLRDNILMEEKFFNRMTLLVPAMVVQFLIPIVLADFPRVEIYVFCKDKAWADYEAIQSDLFDHLLAILPEFDLKVFQYPIGEDLNQLITPRPVQTAPGRE